MREFNGELGNRLVRKDFFLRYYTNKEDINDAEPLVLINVGFSCKKGDTIRMENLDD